MIVHPAERIAYVIRMVSGLLTQEVEQALRPVRLTQVQLAALVQLGLSEGLSTAVLARRCGVTAQSMASALSGLERRSLIRRAAHPIDGRVVEIHITREGQTLAEEAQQLTAGVNAKALALVEPDDRARLHSLLLQIAQGLGLPVEHEGVRGASAAGPDSPSARTGSDH
ncbi:MarR family winged helix-turn-helix transcriptional regulator [Streptomyces coerulescens]|uniref:MarR family winged helix-turn-helix transcriptional regulator n=1 Tax=Streptomyces coerulescens TaxID=29304 RepID=A0ABW0CXW0_STRCD